MGTKIKFAIYVIIIFFLASFGVKNSHPVQLKYYFNFLNIEMPLYGLIFISIVIGIAIGFLMGFVSNFHQRKTIKSLERENKELKEKVKHEKETERP